jgi:hypothetical protein
MEAETDFKLQAEDRSSASRGFRVRLPLESSAGQNSEVLVLVQFFPSLLLHRFPLVCISAIVDLSSTEKEPLIPLSLPWSPTSQHFA